MNILKFILVNLFLILFFSQQKAQGGFKSRFVLNGAANCISKFIYPVDTGFIALGFVTEIVSNQPVYRICVMGLNSKGKLVWSKKYGEKNQHYLNSVSRRSVSFLNNAFYYTGSVMDSLNVMRGVLIKFNLLGDTLWQRHYSDTNKLLVPQAISPSVDGALLITGLFENSSNNTSPCLLLKTDSLGNELWRKQINKAIPNVHDGRAIVQDSVTKKIVVVGYQYIGNSSNWDVFDSFLVLDSLGNLLSHKKYTSAGGIYSDIIQTKDSKFVAVGARFYPGPFSSSQYQRSFAVKVDIGSLNSPQWIINGFGPISGGNGFVLANQRTDGKILFSGGIDTITAYNQPPNVLIRYTLINENTGQVIWNKLYNYKYNSPTTFNSQFPSCTSLLVGNSWISAFSMNNSEVNPFFFVKYDSTGCDTIQEYCMNPVGMYDLNSFSSEILLYPNPTEGNLTISSSGLTEINKILISNSIGQCIREEDLHFEGSKTTLSTSGLEKGIYIIHFKTSLGTITKRFIKN